MPRGFPCCVRFPCVHAVATTPAQRLGHCFAHSPPSFQPSPIWPSGRPAHRPFRGLLGVHSRYGLHTRAVTVFRDTLTRRLQPLRYLHSCSGASGWSGCRVGLAPTGKAPPYHGARHKRALAFLWPHNRSSAIGAGQQGTEISVGERPLTNIATAYSRPQGAIRVSPIRPLAFLVSGHSVLTTTCATPTSTAHTKIEDQFGKLKRKNV
jgi:hypothetical protein